MDYLVDTCFLIDSWRERKRPGPASALALSLADSAFAINWVTAGEFLGGGLLAQQNAAIIEEMLARFTLVPSDTETVNAYAQLYATCRRNKRAIGPNDLWIAASAVRHRIPLITRNQSDFESLPDLEIRGYGA
jgi:predicted nucleic acid-binding protein